jgi:hypothetical protein
LDAVQATGRVRYLEVAGVERVEDGCAVQILPS